MSNPGALKTIGEIAVENGVAIHQVAYVVRARGIEPDMRAGGLRLFGPEASRRVAEALDAVARRQIPGVAGRDG